MIPVPYHFTLSSLHLVCGILHCMLDFKDNHCQSSPLAYYLIYSWLLAKLYLVAGWQKRITCTNLSILAASLNFWNPFPQPVPPPLSLKWSHHPFVMLKISILDLPFLHTCVLMLWEETRLLPKSLLTLEEYGFVVRCNEKSFILMNQRIT